MVDFELNALCFLHRAFPGALFASNLSVSVPLGYFTVSELPQAF